MISNYPTMGYLKIRKCPTQQPDIIKKTCMWGTMGYQNSKQTYHARARDRGLGANYPTAPPVVQGPENQRECARIETAPQVPHQRGLR